MLNKQWIYDWNPQTKLKTKIELVDESLRDALQSPSVHIPSIEEKIKIIDYLEELKVARVDLGLPGAGQKACEEAVVLARHIVGQKYSIKPYCCLRTHIKDIEALASICDKAKTEIGAYTFVGTSPIRQYVENWTVSSLMDTVRVAIQRGNELGLAMTFITEDTTRTPPKILRELFLQAIDLGSVRIVLCDTVGHSTPEGVIKIVKWTRNLIASTKRSVSIDWHGHNDRGLGVINALVALEAGCLGVHGSALGVGERTGNSSLDQIIVNLDLLGKFSGNPAVLVPFVKFCAQAYGIEIPANYPVAGRDAFRTSTGVHASAILKASKKGASNMADAIYSSVPAHRFGCEQVIEIGPMSGKANVSYWLEKNGYKASAELINQILIVAKNSQTILTSNELEKIVSQFHSVSKKVG